MIIIQNNLQRRKILSETDVVLIFDGNSLTNASQYSGVDQYWSKKIRDWFLVHAKSVEFYSYGVNGQSTTNMLSDQITQIIPKIKPSKTTIVFGWEEANAVVGQGRTAKQNYDDFELYFKRCKDAGAEICIQMTGFYPSSPLNPGVLDGDPSPFDRFEEYIEMCRTRNKYVDYRIQLTDCDHIGGTYVKPLDPLYYYNSFHLTALGYDQIYNHIIKFIMSKIFR